MTLLLDVPPKDEQSSSYIRSSIFVLRNMCCVNRFHSRVMRLRAWATTQSDSSHHAGIGTRFCGAPPCRAEA